MYVYASAVHVPILHVCSIHACTLYNYVQLYNVCTIVHDHFGRVSPMLNLFSLIFIRLYVRMYMSSNYYNVTFCVGVRID